MRSATRRAPSLLRALETILSPSGFPYASSGRLFKDAEFGRDSLETGEDLLEIRPDVARAVILRLAELQGTQTNSGVGEEPGKTHHEYRALVIDGRQVDAESARIFHALAREWHLADTEAGLDALTELVNYFTVDATPRFVRLVAAYRERYGDGILDETYVPRHAQRGERSRIRESACAAGEWVARKIEESDIGLLEWCRKTSWEHKFQAWKDGGTSYLHEDGRFANYLGSMASIEVQGLAYDALVAAGSLVAGETASEQERYASLATALSEATIQRFWMPEHEYFAMALDRDPLSGIVRQVGILTSNGASLLESGLFDTLSPETRERYIAPVVRRIFGDEFLTPAGIRCTSLRHKDLQDYPAYQSSYTVWHKETYDIVKGLRRQGFPCLAAELERRLVNTINLAGPKEFIYAMPDNRVGYGPVADSSPAETIAIAATNLPDNDQAWTVAAALACKWRIGRRSPLVAPDPYHTLEEELLRHAGRARLFRTLADVVQARPTDYAIHVDTALGGARESAWVAANSLPERQGAHPVSGRL